MRTGVLGCGMVLCCCLLSAGCAKEDVVKKDPGLAATEQAAPTPATGTTAPTPAEKAPSAPVPGATTPAPSGVAEETLAPRGPAGEKFDEDTAAGSAGKRAGAQTGEETSKAGAATPTGETAAGLEPIYFDFDSAALSEAARNSLNKNYEFLKARGLKVEIEGHCDERGSDEYNLALGELRAKAARTYLVNRGINADRLTTISYGEEKPADPGHDEEAWAKNRRDEFIISR